MAQTAHQAGRIPGLKELASRTEPAAGPRTGTPHPDFTRIRWVIGWLRMTIILVVAGGVTFSSFQERQAAVDDAQREALTIARAIDPHLGYIVAQTGEYLVGSRAVLEAEGTPASLASERYEAIFASRPENETTMRHVVVSDGEGRVAWVAGARQGILTSVRDRRFFQNHAASTDRQPRVSSPFRSRIDGRWRLPVSVRLERPDGSFAGVLNTVIEVEYLSQYFASLGLPEAAMIHLLTDAGEPLVRHPPAPREAERSRVMLTMRAFVEQAEGVFRLPSPITGEDQIGGYRRLGNLPLYAVVATRADVVFAQWRRHTAERILAGAGGLAVTCLLITFLLRRLGGEQSAVQNLAKFRRAVDMSGDYIYILDMEGRILYMNDAAARRRGLDPKHLPPRLHVSDISASYTDLRFEAVRQRLLDNGEGVFEGEHVAGDGSTYPVHASATRVELDGTSVGFLICRDLSDLFLKQREIEELNESLEKRVEARTAELVAANQELESFAYSVSHDLRAPLNHIAAYAEELLEGRGEDLDNSRRLTDKVIERTRYMGELIEGLLALSRIGRAHPECMEVDLSAMAREIDASHRRLQPGRCVDTVVQDGMRAVGSPVLLRTLLDNVIGNAWKYTGKTANARIEVFCEVIDGARAFVVRDNGAGFDPRYATRLFSAFQRLHTPAEFPGTGIGLATASRIVARHGGRIWADAVPGAGATFRFTIRGQTT